jgi:hypothetical protein
MSNAVDPVQFANREARFVEIARKYGRETMATFSHIMGEVVMALEEGAQDILGATFHALELHDKARGQFYTPYPVCQLMARVIAGSAQDMQQAISARGFLLAQEPAVGSGAMIVALAEAIREAGFNYQKLLHVTAVDIDPRAVHMAYIQFSLLHIPATVIVGDTLAMQFREEWHTLAHVMGGWCFRLGEAKISDRAGTAIVRAAGARPSASGASSSGTPVLFPRPPGGAMVRVAGASRVRREDGCCQGRVGEREQFPPPFPQTPIPLPGSWG